MKRFLTAILILVSGVIFGQNYVFNFNQDTTAEGTEFIPFQTRTGTNPSNYVYHNWKMPFPFAKRYFSPNVVASPVGFDPTTATTGQKHNYLGKFVVYNGANYYIDGQGLVLLINNPGVGADTLYTPGGVPLVNGDTIPYAEDAAGLPLADPINFGGIVVEDVQAALEAIDTRLDSAFNYSRGRILYVSKSGWLGTGTEQVGNPRRPYKTPWAAAAVMQNGDLMYCFGKNTYTLGPVSSGADKEGSTVNNFAFWTGNIDTAYFHFEPSTVFKSIGAAGSCFFVSEPASNNLFLRVTGAATFNYSSNGGYTDVFRIITTSAAKTVDFYFEADQFIQTAWSQVRMNGKAVVKVNKVRSRITSGTAATFGFGLQTTSLNARKSHYVLELNEFDFQTTSPTVSDCMALLYGVDTAQVDIKVNNVMYRARSPLVRCIGFVAFLRNSAINVNINNAFIDDQYLNSISSSKSYTISSSIQSIDYSANVGMTDTNRVSSIINFPNGGTSSINNIFNLRIGNLESAMSIANQPGDVSNRWNIEIGNFRQLRKCPLLLNSTSDNQTSTGNINLNVREMVATSPPIIDTENHFNFMVSGCLRVSSGALFQNYSSSTTSKRSFVNCRLINGGASTAIASTAAISTEIMNVFQNSILADDPNVTYLIQSPFKNSNAK